MRRFTGEARIGTYPFVKGLLASLSLQQVVWLDMRGEEHHNRFRQALDSIKAVAEDSPGAVRRFPTFRPSQFTGRYAEFDQALLQAGANGLVLQTPPYFEAIRLNITHAMAGNLITGFESPEQEALAAAATAYISDKV